MAIIEFDPKDRTIRQNPYPCYRSLRENDPVHWNPRIGKWMLMRHRDVMALMRHPGFSSNTFSAEAGQIPAFIAKPLSAMIGTFSRMMLFADPPLHTRLRGLAVKAFTPRMIDAIKPRIAQTADELIAALPAAGFDLVRDFAFPLPAMVIAELLGVPLTERHRIKEWSDRITAVVVKPKPGLFDSFKANRAIAEMNRYFLEIINARRAAPKEDLISQLVGAQEQGKALSEEELLAMCVLLLVAGHETTTNLIGNGVLTLLGDDAARARLQAQLGAGGEAAEQAMARAVEELMRYDSPVQLIARVAKEDTDFGGKTIRKGQQVLGIIGSANRDPEVYQTPDVLDFDRVENAHLSLGYGPHFCLGAALARAEGAIAMSALLRRFPALRCDEPRLEWIDAIAHRGVRRLRVRAN